MKNFSIRIALVAIVFLISSCGGAVKDIRKAAESISTAIEKLATESSEWRVVLPELQEELDSDFSRYINQIDIMLQEAERMALNTSTCVSQYVMEAVVFELEQMRNEITGNVGPSIVDEVPVSKRLVLCHSFNNEVNLGGGGTDELRWSIVGYFGAIGSPPPPLHLNVVDRYGIRTAYDYYGLLTFPGNNELRVDITNLYYGNVLASANTIEIVDTRNGRVLGEYLVIN